MLCSQRELLLVPLGYDRAIHLLQQALAADPLQLSLVHKLAKLCRIRNRYADGLQLIKRTQERLNSTRASVHNLVGDKKSLSLATLNNAKKELDLALKEYAR